MGFWSTLAGIGGAVAAPFTSGLSLAAGPLVNALTGDSAGPTAPGPSTASRVGTTAGSIEQQRLFALIEQARLQQEQDRLGLNRTNTGVNVGNLNLAQQKEALAAPGDLASQSVRGDVLANAQDATVSGLPSYIHVGNVSGGLRPSMLSASSRALGGQMSRNALADSTSGKYTTQAPLPSVPTAIPLPSASGFDKVLQGGAIGGSFLDALRNVPGANLNIGNVPGDITDAQTQLRDPNVGNVAGGGIGDVMTDPEANATTGIDPAIMAWLQQQADPTTGGTNG